MSPMDAMDTDVAALRSARASGFKLAGIFGFLAVALGAFGAHALKERLTPEMLEIWKTGVLYHLVHAAFLAAVAGAGARLVWAQRLAVAGIVLFSGSLYALALSGVKILGAVTPFGGLCFLAAWALVAVQAFRRQT